MCEISHPHSPVLVEHKMAASLGIRGSTAQFGLLSVSRPVRSYAPVRRSVCKPVRVIELDFSDPDTQLGVAGVVLVRSEWPGMVHALIHSSRPGNPNPMIKRV